MTIPITIQKLRRLADATPDPCEGSRGHCRQDFTYELESDYRDAMDENPRVLALYEAGMTFGEIMHACEEDARSALARWKREDAVTAREDFDAAERAAILSDYR